MTKWNYEKGGGGWGNNELEFYTDKKMNIDVLNGQLMIIARNESYKGFNYSSARINTKNLYTCRYGKIEARIKFPIGQGLWPAFWMLGQNIDTVGWPACGELDIMEHVNSESRIYGTMHWDKEGYIKAGGSTFYDSMFYHVYSLEWNPNDLEWSIDGIPYLKECIEIADKRKKAEAFHKSFYILLNLAVGGNWCGNPDQSTIFPDTMYVDYVRVYVKSPGK